MPGLLSVGGNKYCVRVGYMPSGSWLPILEISPLAITNAGLGLSASNSFMAHRKYCALKSLLETMVSETCRSETATNVN